jgi:hypothetical protein
MMPKHGKVKTDKLAAAEIRKAQFDQIGASIRDLGLAALARAICFDQGDDG